MNDIMVYRVAIRMIYLISYTTNIQGIENGKKLTCAITLPALKDNNVRVFCLVDQLSLNLLSSGQKPQNRKRNGPHAAPNKSVVRELSRRVLTGSCF